MSSKLAYAVYDRPFAQPFRYGDKVLTSRRGVVLRKGSLFSEASPLPGHSTDTFVEVLRALATRPSKELLELSASEHGELPPSLRFALEGFVALESPGTHPVRSNALFRWKDREDAATQLGQLSRAGYRVCKIKIGPHGMAELLDVIEESEGFTFRLDANRSLDPASLTKLFESLERRKILSRVEYLEEPFTGIWDKSSFHGLPLALAADESAPSPREGEKLFTAKNPPSVFIVKPTVAGGLFSLGEYVSTIRAAGKTCVFTSALEAEPGRRALIAFLSRAPHSVSGLSTGHLFLASFLGDAASYTSVPAPSAAELSFLETLTWKECS